MDGSVSITTPQPLLLVADDDRDLCGMLSEWLGQRFQIMLAFDGDDALTIAHRCTPDVALVDVMMPRLSGFGLIWAFTHHPRLSKMPVAFMTAYHDTAKLAPRGRKVLHKPFRKQELDEVIEALLRAAPSAAPRESSIADQRRTNRAEVEIDAVLHRAEVSLPGQVLSLSLLGAYFRGEGPLPIGSTWTLTFRHQGVRFDIPVEAIHNLDRRGFPGSGLCLYDMGLEGEGKLQKLLEELAHP